MKIYTSKLKNEAILPDKSANIQTCRKLSPQNICSENYRKIQDLTL